MHFSSLSLEKAVCSVCDEINREAPSSSSLDENQLWQRLVVAMLGSAVPYELALGAAQALDNAGLIDAPRNDIPSEYETTVSKVLSTPFQTSLGKRRYRFPKSRARYLANTRIRFSRNKLNLKEIVYNTQSPEAVRETIVSVVDGIGPKQASMFLRDCGSTDDLAILDRHVLNYMRMVDLISIDAFKKFSAKSYLVIEKEFSRYADFLGYSVGCLDLAIWTVMRVAQRGT